MKFELVEKDEEVVIRPYGRIDSVTSDEFSHFLDNHNTLGKSLVLDFIETEYISSSGLRVLLGYKKKHQNQGMKIINTNSTVYEVLELTGFIDMMEVEKISSDSGVEIKAVFFDIDGTLLSHTLGAIPQSTIDAIKKLQEKGIKVVISTGRDINEIKKLPLDGIDFDAYLTLNGNICLDKDEKMFAGNPISDQEIDVLVNIFKAGRIPFVLVGESKRYINYVDDTVIKTQFATHGTIPDIGEYHGEKIYQCIAFVDGATRQKLDSILDQCVITSWNETGIDIIAETGGKAAGIRRFLEYENIKHSQTMAFGDGENDISMIEMAGIGVAMDNGVEKLKQKADYVTTSVDDDGIANALKHFGIID